MAGTIKVNSIALGDDATASRNLVIRTNQDGTFTLARGNVGATTQDILTFDANGKVSIVQGPAARTDTVSMVRLNTANGYGSTNTVIRRFSTVVTNTGTDITYADSATAGASITINASGVYAISYTDFFNGVSSCGISLNSSQLTSSIGSITAADRLAMQSVSGADLAGTVALSLYLASGSVIRPHANGTPSGTAPAVTQFTIVRVS